MAQRKRAPAKARAPGKRGKSRLSRADWVEGALEGLAQGGLAGLAVDALAQRLGVTKGSFYWHFRDTDELLQAVVSRWEELAVDRVMSDLLHVGSPCAVLREVIARTVRIDDPERRLRYRVEAAAGALAEWHPVVRPAYLRIMQRRLNGLVVLYLAAGVPMTEAAKLAQLAYMTLIGVYPVLLCREPLTDADRDQLVEQLNERMLPPPCKG